MAVHFWLKKIWKSKFVDHLITAQMSRPGFALSNVLTINMFILLQHFQVWKPNRWCNVGILKRNSIFKFNARILQHKSQRIWGVDLADILIALYGTKIMTKKCWYLKIIFRIVDICKVSGWLLYRRHCKQNSIASKHQMSLLYFVTDVFLVFSQSSKPVLLGRKKRIIFTAPTKDW